MPMNNKKGKRRGAEAATAETDGEFDDMLAEVRAADLIAATASISNSSGSGASTSTNTSPANTNVASTSSSTANAIEIPEERITDAVEQGNLGQLRRWGRQGVRVTSSGPLCYAAAGGWLDIVQCLIKELEAAVDQTTNHGRTALHLAAASGQIAVAQCLVQEFDANINQEDEFGTTPLIFATREGDLAMVLFLVSDLQADVNKADLEGRTPLCYAAQKGNLAMVRVLVKELHADVDKADHGGCSPLWFAAQEGHLAIVQCLVKELGADIDQEDQYGGTPLMMASAKKHAGVVKWLVKAGADTQAFLANEGSDATAASISKIYGASAEQTAYLVSKTHCSNIGCSGAGLFKCTGCGRARYCVKACQLTHWKAHKADCRRWSAEAACKGYPSV
jgi:ankyrin repeat protein